MKNISKRWLALALAAVMVISATAVGIGMTYASSPVQERFQQENTYTTVEAGYDNTALLEDTTGFSDISSSDTKILTAAKTKITGVSAGVAAVCLATRLYAINLPIQVTDSTKLSGYDITNSGEINKKSSDPAFNVNDSITAYVTPRNATVDGDVDNANYIKNSTADAAKAKIQWKSRNTEVADCELDGTVTPNNKGTTVLLGEFTDRWGKPRTITVLLGVDTIVGRSILSDLMDVINKAKAILGLDPNPYQEAGLGTLQGHVTSGETLLASTNPDEAQVESKIDAIEKAIKDLKFKAGIGDGLINVGDQYFKPAGPENVYEIVDENGNSMQPEPKYIYDEDGSLKRDPPTLGDEVPAYKDDYVYYVQEEPVGSNIFVPIKADGTKDYDSAVWGGANGLPERTDSPAVKSGSTWYAEDPKGSNLWKPVLTSASAGSEQGKLVSNTGDWVGGGEDGKPTGNDNLYPIVEKNGQIVAGEFGPDGDGEKYFIGMGGDGRFDTKGSGGVPVGHEADARDVKLYDQGDGTFGLTPPIKAVKPSNIGPSSLPSATAETPYSATLTADGDAATWTVSSGSLPTGLSLSTAGVISGTPSAPGTYDFTVKAKNAGGEETKTMTIVVVEAVSYPTTTSVELNSTSIAMGGDNLIPLAIQTDVTTSDDHPLTPTFTTETYDLTKHEPATFTIPDRTGLHDNTKIYYQGAFNVSLGIRDEDVGKPITVKVQFGSSGPSDTAMFALLPLVGTDGIPVDGTGRKTDGGDGSEWIEIATNGGYSLILRANVLPAPYSPTMFGSNNNYSAANCNARNNINSWYDTVDSSAKIKQWAVDNNAKEKRGLWNSGITDANGFSSPITSMTQSEDIAFLLSCQEASVYCGVKYYPSWGSELKTWPSSSRPYLNFNALDIKVCWLRTPGNAGYVSTVGSDGFVDPSTVPMSYTTFNLRPALWVMTNGFTWTNF